MNRIFRALSISNKLAAVFLVLLFMMGVGGSVGLYNGSQIAEVTEHLYMDSFRRADTLSALEKEFLSQRHELFLHTIISEGASKSYLEGSIAEHREKILRLFDEYASFSSEAYSPFMATLKEGLAAYWGAQKEVVALSVAGEKAEALNLLRGEGDAGFTSALHALRKLINEERETSYLAYRKIKSFTGVIVAVTLGFTLIAIIVAGALWLTLTRSLVSPILAIEDSAKKLAQGDLKQRVPVMTEDELGSLASEFNAMAQNLENHYATLEKTVRERTEELRYANEELLGKKRELEATNQELERANDMKNQFLANVSHEFRTPLNSIIGFSELLKDKSFGQLNTRQGQYIDFIHTSGNHLLNLINSILDLSKIEVGKLELDYEEFSVMEVLTEVLDSIRPLAQKMNVTIESKTAPASPVLKADKAKFKQIMLNLLSNAVKFNVENGNVNIDWNVVEEPSGMRIQRYILFAVKDTGIGIDEKDKDRVFKEFEQLDPSVTREHGGTGLGLALTKRLVELHNGEIRLKSEPQKGSTFTVKLPQCTEKLDIPVCTVPESTVLTGDGDATVLLACESSDLNQLLSIYMAEGVYDVVTADDGLDLLRKARELRPFAVIMGVTLPKKDGWEIIKELRENQETEKVPVIIVSSTDDRARGRALGHVEFLDKPVTRNGVLGALGRIASRIAPPGLTPPNGAAKAEGE